MQLHNHLLALFNRSTGVTIDSRNVTPGQIFFAFKGEHTDGNIYADSAIEKGALAVITDQVTKKNTNEKYIFVEDTLTTLQNLATDYRRQFNIPFLALTGSNGKTTTKELIYAVLNQKYKCAATRGNLNNHIGVPITILSIPRETQIVVVEMGANHQNEIALLCNIAQPTHGLITNIGKAHLEGFGGVDGVVKGKGELFDYLIANNGVIFHNSNNVKLADKINKYSSVILYGDAPDNYLYGMIQEQAAFAEVVIENEHLHSNLVGNYNGYNILAAACVGKYFDIPLSKIKAAIENYQPQNNRSQWQQTGDNYFILDAYNANPSSMQVAIDHFDKMQVHPKILILGDMLELGEYAETEHRQIINSAMQKSFDAIILVGPVFSALAPPDVVHFQEVADAKIWFDKQQFHNSYFLIKGSRGIKLEKITEGIM